MQTTAPVAPPTSARVTQIQYGTESTGTLTSCAHHVSRTVGPTMLSRSQSPKARTAKSAGTVAHRA
ncbi:hypothetical protein DN508_33710 [Burkholderia multivorans]|nr:hypothetical protein DN508_33710 [Burkholderia multivorans]